MSKYYIIVISIITLISGCSGCAKSGRPRRGSSSSSLSVRSEATKEQFSGSAIVRMKKEGGIYTVPVKINGTAMDFIFDTGAGLISISNVEASFMYKQGTLTDEDFLGKADFIDANGDVSPGVIINLKQVSIGNRTIHNIKASVVNNSKAPLLLGQSAMEEFGNFSINYKKGLITFE